MKALVVMPTYQEAGNIADVLRRVRTALPDGHVLVVDDSSPDGTAAIARTVALEVGDVEVLERPARSGGLGAAYREGFGWALQRGYDVVFEMDADLSHDPAELPTLLAAVRDGADLVIGSRYIPGGSIPSWARWRRALSRWGNRYADAVLRLGVSDATSGFRAYAADALADVDFERVRANGYAFQIEMAYRLVRRGRKVTEVPIVFIERAEGTSKMNWRIIVEALALVTGWGLRDRISRRQA